jgi:hypothetical protein
LRVEREFAVVGKELEEVKAVEEYFFLFDGESFGDGVDGVFGPEWGNSYMSTLVLIRLNIFW